MTYSIYKKSELYTVIESSEFSETEYEELRGELEATQEAVDSTADASSETFALLRFAMKHLCRKYPHYGVRHYRVTGVSHTNSEDVVESVVDATHEEKAKFYFHTRFNHTEYRVTKVELVDNSSMSV